MARPKSLIPMLNFTTRIPVALRDELLAACAANDVQATQVVRLAMRAYVAAAQRGASTPPNP